MQNAPFGIGTKFLRVAGSQVTCAGEFPWKLDGEDPQSKLLCFGTDDGSICIYDTDGKRIDGDRAPQNLESINGIAFTPQAMAVSTPGEILIQLPPTKDGQPKSLCLEQGAYGIIPAKNDGFIAPLGKNGLLHMRRVSENSFIQNHFHPVNGDTFFYKIASVGTTEEGGEIFACAGRRSGLVTVLIDSLGQPQNIWLNQGVQALNKTFLDIIDVCPIPSPHYPFAVVCLGIDDTLHFTFDIRHENPTVGLKLLGMRGTAYTVLAAQGHIFVLTSEEFCVFPNLAETFHSNQPFNHKVLVHRNRINAIDCSMAYGNFILMIVEAGVLVLDIGQVMSELGRPSAGSRSHGEELVSAESLEIWAPEPVGELQMVVS